MIKFIWIVITFAAFSIGASAQNDSLLKAYSGWKEARTAELADNGGVHYGLAVATKRTSADQGTLEFMSVGDIGKLTVKITPVTIERNEAGKIINQFEGETVMANQAIASSKTNSTSELKVIVPIQRNSNAVKVVWDLMTGGEKTSTTILLPLESDASVNFIGIVPKDAARNVIDLTSRTVGCGEDC